MNRCTLFLTLIAAFFIASSPVRAETAGATAKTSPAEEPAGTPASVDMIVQVNVASPFEPKEAVGLLISSSGMIEKPAIEVKKISEGLSVISFGYSRGEVRKDTFASAMVISPRGEVAFGDMRSLASSGLKISFYSIPQCPPEKAPTNIDSSRFGMYEMLVNYRVARRDTYRKQIEETLSGSFLEDLSKLERGFGLARSQPIGPSLTPLELIDRLSRIKTTVIELSQRETHPQEPERK